LFLIHFYRIKFAFCETGTAVDAGILADEMDGFACAVNGFGGAGGGAGGAAVAHIRNDFVSQ
jgi:hypothetical protein